MCGRYTYKLTWAEIVSLYQLTLPEDEPPGLKPSYNVAPTHVMPIIRPAGNGRELVMAGWGLVPFWLKPEQLGKQPYSTINARAETIRTAPTYREPFKTKRCLVPATGWYEWQKLDAKKKRPIHMCAKSTPFALAGVYDVWKGDGGKAKPAMPSLRRTPRRAWRSFTTACPSCSMTRNSMTGCVPRLTKRQR
jgi:putative SOS response-associated peptidase YedK